MVYFLFVTFFFLDYFKAISPSLSKKSRRNVSIAQVGMSRKERSAKGCC